MGTSFSSAMKDGFEQGVLKGNTKANVIEWRRLVHDYATKGKENFEKVLGDVETAMGKVLTPVQHTAAWGAIVDFEKILKGFKGKNYDLFIKEICDTGRKANGQAICLCIGDTMRWGTNIKTIRTNFLSQIFLPLKKLHHLCNEPDSISSDVSHNIDKLFALAYRVYMIL